MSRMPSQSLTVVDNRTGKTYDVPIQDDSIDASKFASMRSQGSALSKTDDAVPGLKVFDDCLRNTAVRKSSISYLYAALCLLNPCKNMLS